MAQNVWDFFGNSVTRDLLDICIGNKLGSGMSREVFEFGPDPSLVVKFETSGGCFQNVLEWETWLRVKDTKAAKWFAPCVRVSEDGKVLLMQRTNPFGWDARPNRMPRFFTDLKISNYGILNGQVVAHDYGVHLLMEEGMKCQLVKADWWEEGRER